MLFRRFRWIRVVRDNSRAKSLGQDFASEEPNLSGADDPNGLAADVDPEEPIEEEVSFANAVVGLVVFADHSHDHPNGKFCNRFRGVGGYPGDFDAIFCGSLKVDVVETCTSQRDEFLLGILRIDWIVSNKTRTHHPQSA